MGESYSYDHILIRYGELGLKGKNQKEFLKTLVSNVRNQLRLDLGEPVQLERQQGRLLLSLQGLNPEKVYSSLQKVFGISSFSPVIKTALDENEIIQAALSEAKDLKAATTFRVSVKRANKQFPISSMAFQQIVAEALLDACPQLIPNLVDYEVNIAVDIRFEAAYVYVKTFKGLGGLPLGSGGRAMILLSGGIDSPVAGWMMMRRGVVIEAIHFHSHPYTSKEAEKKVLDLARRLSAYGHQMVVHLVPFTAIQEAIGASCHANLRITIMRRIMLRIAEQLAHKRHAKAIVTGDNIGQVASQTLDSLFAINQVTSMPVLRPLLTFDKVDIIEQAKKIGTYGTSVLPYEDCCTVFVPKEPKTKPKAEVCAHEEKRITDLDALIERAIEETESIFFRSDRDDRKRILFAEMQIDPEGV